MVVLLCAASIAAVFKGSRDPDPAHVLISSPLGSSCRAATICEIKVISFTRSKYNAIGPKIKKNRPCTSARPVCGYFVIHNMGLAKI